MPEETTDFDSSSASTFSFGAETSAVGRADSIAGLGVAFFIFEFCFAFLGSSRGRDDAPAEVVKRLETNGHCRQIKTLNGRMDYKDPLLFFV